MQNDWFLTITNALGQMSDWEVSAALMGVAYILLAAKTSQWCWLFAFLSTLIYTVIFWEGQLPMQAILNFYYMGMAVYGFWLWRKHGNAEDTLNISSWRFSKQLGFIAAGIVISWALSLYLQANVQSKSPVLDATITVFSVMNTWLMAKKVLQNWLYWVVIDAAAVVLYFQTAYFATMVLFILNTVLAFSGFISWLRLYRAQN